MVEFGLLGGIEAAVDRESVDLGPVRQRSVLAALLVDVNRVVTVDQLIDRVWGESPPQRSLGTLYSYISRLRRALPSAADEVRLVRQAGGYVLTVTESAVDLYRFRGLVTQAHRTDDDERAVALFEQALGLWQGDAFSRVDTPWFNTLRESLHQERLTAELDLGDVQLRLGRHSEVLARLFDRAAAHPLDERLAGQLMLALYRSGRAGDALAHYQRVRRCLAEELGTDPGLALRQLYQQILTVDPALAARSAAGFGPARPPVPRQLPAPPSTFTGRTPELAHLDAVLEASADQGALW